MIWFNISWFNLCIDVFACMHACMYICISCKNTFSVKKVRPSKVESNLDEEISDNKM